MDKAKLSKLRHDGHITDAEYKEMIRMCDRDQELIRKFREVQNGHRVDGGFYRGVSACLRIVLNEYEIPEPPGDFETRGCCQ
jgi:hypothetical protein